MIPARLWRIPSVLGLSAITLSVGPTPIPNAAAPWIIIVHGDLLPQRVVMSDWQENSRLMGAINVSTPADTTAVHQRPYVHLAMFWGPEWANYPRTTEALAQLRPEQANQHGRFYPARADSDALVLIGSTTSRADTTLGPIAEHGLALLERYGVPVRVDE